MSESANQSTNTWNGFVGAGRQSPPVGGSDSSSGVSAVPCLDANMIRTTT